VADIDITSATGANDAIKAIDAALTSLNSQRADLGAIQNRFTSTIDAIATTSENLSAAQSRILDADFAAETAKLSKAQVLQQAGISVLAQANARPQQVLSLLQ
jgi:flagellin